MPNIGAAATAAPRCTNLCTKGVTRCTSATTLETCIVRSNGCTAFTALTCANGTVCEREAPACVDPEWAEWQMPNGDGDVAIGAPHLETLVDNLDGTVTDRVTGLMWEQSFRQSDLQNDAETYCTSVRTAGYADWRLPTIIELISIGDFTRDAPTIDTQVFPLTADSLPFWSSTIQPGDGNYADILSYNVLGIQQSNGLGAPGPNGINIRCVR
jgi:hypothetical protein